jgi:hypothetical protein
MGSFFRSNYDLFREIKEGPKPFLTKIQLVLAAARREDLGEDVKDAVMDIGMSDDFETAYNSCNSLMAILNEAVGVQDKIKKRDQK